MLLRYGPENIRPLLILEALRHRLPFFHDDQFGRIPHNGRFPPRAGLFGLGISSGKPVAKDTLTGFGL